MSSVERRPMWRRRRQGEGRLKRAGLVAVAAGAAAVVVAGVVARGSA